MADAAAVLVVLVIVTALAVAVFLVRRRRSATAHDTTPHSSTAPIDVAPPAEATPPAPPAPAAVPGRERLPRAAILTPDQRIRVFVSSTLHELSAERSAVRRAIEALHLTPVMFEMGARPHPPRDLYRAYLAQSDVFVAIYGERYGWIAPGEAVSGLEDEYHLSAGMPRLVYVRKAISPREPELERLLGLVRAADDVSYRSFTTAEELADLVRDDLALLMSERFLRRSRTSDEGEAAPLPQVHTSFVGREALIASLEALLRQRTARLVTLYGPAGSGKSRLATEAAGRLRQHFGGDVRYVSLASVRDPALVASTLAIGLGVMERPGVAPEAALREALAEREGLLVIDTFEHVLEAAPVVADLVQAAPRLTLLVTSRALLRLGAEVVVPVPPLELPPEGAAAEMAKDADAVRLFLDRALAVDAGFTPSDRDLVAIVELCRRVDALPLAIELAAARTRSLPPRLLLERMTKRLPVLAGGPRDAPARQRTLRAAIEWSVTLLSDAERRLFARLAVFEGGATLDAVERVLGHEGDVLDRLGSLIDKSLIHRRAGADEERLVMLDTVRELAAEELDADPEVEALRLRHAEAFLELAERGASELRRGRQAEWLTWLRRDLGNLRAALERFQHVGRHADALRLATALRPFFMATSHYTEGRRLVERALATAGDEGGRHRTAALLALGALAWRQGDLAAAEAPAEEALALSRAGGDLAGVAAALRLLGVRAHNMGDYDAARARLEEALVAQRRLGDAEAVASALLSLGNVAFDRGDEGEARRLYEESHVVSERLGDHLGIAYALDNLGVLEWCRGDLEASARHSEAAAQVYERIEHPFGLASVEHRRGLLALARRDLAVADAHFRRCLALRTAIGDTRGSAFVHHDLARTALEAGRIGEARAQLDVAFDLAGRHGAALIEALLLETTAAYLAARGEHAVGATLWAAAAAWRRSQGIPVCPVNRAWSEVVEGALASHRGVGAGAADAPLELGEAVGIAHAAVAERGPPADV
jgi:predicted ATPase